MNNANQWIKNINKDDNYWAKNLDNVPTMICYSYRQLKELTHEGQVYGAMLQCKDLYELLYKIPIIMVLIIIESNPKYKDFSAYTDIIKASLGTPMSMGNWDSLARIIVKKNKSLNLPEPLIEIIRRTCNLYTVEISTHVPDVINWRNSEIGHGALRFEDDESYKEDISKLLIMLKEYFDGEGKYSIKGLYDHAFLGIGNKKLVNDNHITDEDSGALYLVVESEKYETANYADNRDLKCFVFDSYYYKKKVAKYSSYINGQNISFKNKHFSELYEKYVAKATNDFSINSNFISREEDLALECLSMPLDYVKPVYLIERLSDTMNDLEKGVITIFMERGTGKSAFSNQMSGLYHRAPLIKRSLSRCYHIQNASFRGLNDFINSVNFSFRHSYDHAQDLWGSNEELSGLTMDTNNPAGDMAAFLNYYHRIYNKDYTILLLDGIDEITEHTKAITEFIPSQGQLEEGVFIVLLSRFKDEETVIGNSKRYIEFAEQISDSIIEIRREDKSNVDLLESFLNHYYKSKPTKTEIDYYQLIQQADYRFLYLKAYLLIDEPNTLDNNNEYSFIKSYMNYILSFYGLNQKHRAIEIAVTIALLSSISVNKYQEYMNCLDITYEFVGLFNDLLPLLTVKHVNGENIYEFADSAYIEFILNKYLEITEEVIRFFYNSMESHLSQYFKHGGGLRFYEIDQVVDEEQLNKDIVFFAEGLLSIWKKTSINRKFSDLFFSSLVLIDIAAAISSDPWAKQGYGNVLKNELFDCFSECLLLGIKKERDGICQEWVTKVSSMLSKAEDRKFSFHRALLDDNDFNDNEGIKSVYEYLKANYTEVNDFDEWFWLFEFNHIPEITEISLKLNIIDKYVDYMMCHSIWSDYWIEIILEYNLPSQIEQKILNYKLKWYIDPQNINRPKNYQELAKECFTAIKAKGYEITLGDKYLDLIEGIQSEQFDKIQLEKKIEAAIKDLLDFRHPMPPTTPRPYEAATHSAYSSISKYAIEQNSIQDTSRLHQAFYKRLCFEKDHGDLVYFLENETEFNYFLEDIFKSVFPEKGQWINGILDWVEIIRPYSEPKNRCINVLLANMMIKSVKHLLNHDYGNALYSTIEKMAYEFDTIGFFTSILSSPITKAQMPLRIYSEPKMVYCTDNVLYTLNLFFSKGEVGKFQLLINTLETSIPMIDNDHIPSRQTQAMCEVQKYRFLRMRKTWQVQNSFDEYLDKIICVHFQNIYYFLSNMTRQSDFDELSFNIELTMEYIWQTEQWDSVDTICNSLLKTLNSSDLLSDGLIKQCIDDEIRKIEECRSFFAFISGKEEPVSRDEYYLTGSYYRINTLYWTVNGYKNNKTNIAKDKCYYLNNNKIKLKTYF